MTKAGELGIGANGRYEDSETLLSKPAPSYSSNSAGSFFKRTLLAKNDFERPAKYSFVPRTYLVVRILSALLSLVIVGMLARVISVYYYSREEQVPADRIDEVITWPPKERFETAPTLMLLGAAATAALLGLAVVVLNFMKSTRGRRGLGNTVALVVGVVVVALVAAVAVVYKITEAPWDLLSFTCAYGDARTHDKVIDELEALCYQTRFGWYGGIAVGVLEVVALALAIFNWFRARNKSKGKGVYVPLAKKNNVAQQGNGSEHSVRLGHLAKPPPQQVGRPVHISNGYEYWEVEDVLEMRETSAGAREYLVRWKGFSPSHDSWVPEEHLSTDWLQYFQNRTKRAKWAVDNTYWEVEEITDWRRPRVGATEYLIRWKGFGSDYDSWEPEGNVDASLVTEFKRRKGIA